MCHFRCPGEDELSVPRSPSSRPPLRPRKKGGGLPPKSTEQKLAFLLYFPPLPICNTLSGGGAHMAIGE